MPPVKGRVLVEPESLRRFPGHVAGYHVASVLDEQFRLPHGVRVW